MLFSILGRHLEPNGVFWRLGATERSKRILSVRSPASRRTRKMRKNIYIAREVMRAGIIVSALLVGVAVRHKILEPTAQPVPPQFEKFMIGEPPRACARVALPKS